MTEDERREMRRRCWRRWYQEMKADPARYADYLAKHRVWQKKYDVKKALEGLPK